MTKAKPKHLHKKGGKRPHQPSDQTRGEVRGMALANLPQEQIAKAIGIDEKTLVKHYRPEIETGRTKLLAGAATNMARMALGAKAEYDDRQNLIRAEIKPDLGACCFVLKTQGKAHGWSERLEHTGANGAPLGRLFDGIKLSNLSNGEFEQLLKLLRKCGVEIQA